MLAPMNFTYHQKLVIFGDARTFNKQALSHIEHTCFIYWTHVHDLTFIYFEMVSFGFSPPFWPREIYLNPESVF